MKSETTSEKVFPEYIDELILTIQSLSLARNIDSIANIVRHKARKLTGADGATFVLRDNGMCYYVDEDAIAPLWKGKKFPMETCISGWAMLNRKSVVIEDIYKDDRIPIEAYRPTFVKSLLMVPIRTQSPIGAIGNYWATNHKPTSTEIEILQALADSASVAIENAQLYENLEKQIKSYKSLSDELKLSLNEKEVLLKEVYHRVKNNLQIVSSLLNLQSESIVEHDAKSMFTESISRIYAMSIVHEMLYRSDNKTNIRLDEYIGNLIKNICNITSYHEANVAIDVDIDPIMLNIDQAIPCGLIINELIANVYKHHHSNNAVHFSLKVKTKNGNVVLIASDDNGVDTSAATSKGKLGLNLVKQLAKQLGGKANFSGERARTIEISFPHKFP